VGDADKIKMKKAAIVNPYLDTLGGGERYTLGVATALAKNGFQVDVQWDDPKIKDKLQNRFGINLKNVNFVEDVKRGDGYDICFWVSDGSIPLLRARRNWLHFQVPFSDVEGKTLMNKMKFFRINEIICNSKFTKNVIDKSYGVNSGVIYPPVVVSDIKPKRKQNIILSVGRFSRLKQSKNQDKLVEAFKKLYDSGVKNYKLILAGGAEVGNNGFVNELKKSAKGYPISIKVSPKFSEIKDLYGKAKIYWSAAGMGVDEQKHPEKTEHFGITVVEAMAAKAVPIIFRAGGHKEIITDNINGLFFENNDTLIDKTIALFANSKNLRKLADQAHKDSKIYSYEKFEKKIAKLL